MSSFGALQRWLHLKHYQLELTFGVYMYTPWEKFAFCTFKKPEKPECHGREHNPPLSPSRPFANQPSDATTTDSIVFLLSGLGAIAAALYLPHHIYFLLGRAWYYINGEHIDVAASARDAVKDMTAGVLGDAYAATSSVTEVVKQTVDIGKEL